MCVIMYKPSGASLPTKETIRAMWDSNRDGAGFMWKNPKTNEIHYRKGYFDFNTFYNDIKAHYRLNREMAIHCRIATSGGVNKSMCHPFPMVKNNLMMKSSHLDSKTYPFVMHNGVISTTFVDNLSDTCSYIINSLVPRYKKDKLFFYNPFEETSIKNEIGASKLLIFSPLCKAKMIGDWTEIDGCYFSNTHFAWRLNKRTSVRKSYNYDHINPYTTKRYRSNDNYDAEYDYRNSDMWREYFNILSEDA